jgi:rhodanese-related sulfurtransferase
MTLPAITPAAARDMIERGARLIDIREPDEHARERIAGAVNVPLARLDRSSADGAAAVIYHCRSGARTAANAARLADAASGPAFILDGGLDGWRRAGQATFADRSQPLEIMRQVQLAAGGLVLVGVLLGVFVAPAFLGLSAFVGAGLMTAGATGWCGMARLLANMPWNRRSAAA